MAFTKTPHPPVQKTCEKCSALFTTSFKRRAKRFCSVTCARRWNSPAVKAGVRKAVVEGRWQGWKTRAGKAPSYPEQYFIDLFTNEGVSFERELKAGRWFIDFAIGNLAIEIDGKQHEDPERKRSDELKDEYLKSSGWKVLRIKWFNPRTEHGKSLLYPQIEHMKKTLGD